MLIWFCRIRMLPCPSTEPSILPIFQVHQIRDRKSNAEQITAAAEELREKHLIEESLKNRCSRWSSDTNKRWQCHNVLIGNGEDTVNWILADDWGGQVFKVQAPYWPFTKENCRHPKICAIPFHGLHMPGLRYISLGVPQTESRATMGYRRVSHSFRPGPQWKIWGSTP